MDLDKIIESNIGRIVAGVLTPVLLPTALAFCAWFQAKVGIDLDPAALVAFIVTVGVGIVAVAYKWLSNRGEFERAVLELKALYEAGQQAQQQGEPGTIDEDTTPRRPDLA